MVLSQDVLIWNIKCDILFNNKVPKLYFIGVRVRVGVGVSNNYI